jgi:hypothetical protein
MDFIMKRKSRIQIASEIIAQLKREMKKPRWAESVSNRMCAQAAQGAKEPEARFERV